MTALDFRPGNTFIARAGKLTHLYIVLTLPMGDPAEVIVANLTTKGDWTDPTVVLNKDDHRFIEHPTSVAYLFYFCVKALRNPNLLRNLLLGHSERFTRRPHTSASLSTIRQCHAVSVALL